MLIRRNTGQTLVPTLGITLALTLIVGAISINFIQERKEYIIKNQRDDLLYAVKSSEKIALSNLVNTMTYSFKTQFDIWEQAGGTSNYIMSDSTAQTLFSSIVGSTPTELSDSPSGINTSNGQKIFISYVPFDDQNNDFTKSPNEPGITFIRQDFDSLTNQRIVRYSYTVTSYAHIGQSASDKKIAKKITTTGLINLIASPKNLAEFALLMNNSSGAYFGMADTVNGPVHTNQSLYLYGTPNSATFLSKVSQVGKTVVWNGGSGNVTSADYTIGQPAGEVNVSNPKLVVGGVVKVNPTFSQGLTVNADTIPLPQSTKNMERISMGRSLTEINNMTPMTESEKATELGVSLVSGLLPKDIYIPNTGTDLKGGIYVNGNVESIELSVDGSGNQVYDIKQSTSSKRKIITINKTSNTTEVKNLNYTTGATLTTLTYNGIPRGSIHVEGAINSLGGKARPTGTPNDPNTAPAAIQRNNKLNISAKGTIRITKDIKYQDDPRIITDAENILGIMSGEGKVMIADPAPKDITVHGIVLSGNTTVGTFGVENFNTRARNGSIHTLGGTLINSLSATENSTSTTGYGTDSVYDVRTGAGQAPPYFPRGPVTQQNPEVIIGSVVESQVKL